MNLFYEMENYFGLWSNAAGGVLYIRPSISEYASITFTPNKASGPVNREFFDERPTIAMQGSFRSDNRELYVELGSKGVHPRLNLVFELAGFHSMRPGLVPSITYLSESADDSKMKIEWLYPLSPYFRVDPSEWMEFEIFNHIEIFTPGSTGLEVLV